MSQPHPDRDLHRLHDGELSADEAAVLRERVSKDAAARTKLAALGELRRAVRTAAPVPDAAESDALWARIAEQIATPSREAATGAESAAPKETRAAVERPALRVVPGGRSAEPARGDARAVDSHHHEGRGRRLATVIIASLAVAAATLLVLLRPGEEPVAEETHTDGGTAQPEQAIAVTEEPSHTEVLEVDFGMNTGTVFAVEGEGGERYAVVWLQDDEKPATAVE